MTKCIVLGQEPTEVKKKPIEFVNGLSADMEPFNAGTKPSDYRNVELICKSYGTGELDAMFAYDTNRAHGLLFFGKWNDGVAE